MVERGEVSEAILAAMSAFTFLLLCVMPGALLWFALPSPFGLVAMLLCGCCGPILMWKVDAALYGRRQR
jgi:hypothetical protein